MGNFKKIRNKYNIVKILKIRKKGTIAPYFDISTTLSKLVGKRQTLEEKIRNKYNIIENKNSE